MTDSVNDILEQLARRQPLTDIQADRIFNALLQGELGPAQAGAFLMGLRAKGEDSTDLAAGVRAGLEHARPIPGLSGVRIDTCGTGGDNACSFNCSTAVALFLAEMGYQVVKHGNRAVSSSCGSADVLEALGLPLDTEPDQVASRLAADKFVFLFAPAYHPAFRHIMPVRRELGIRTLFNLMGPLLNPARPTHQLIGVGDPAFLFIMGEALLLTGVERALVVHGTGGYDELTTFGPARCYIIKDGIMEKTAINPQKLGFERHAPEDVTVKDKDHAVGVMREILAGNGPKAMAEMAALNLAACLYLLEEGKTLIECAEMARAAVKKGVGSRVLHA
ncbi:anthranilate phosphoribosyltransferase [Desulfonatronum thiosulfatophilum]|uniref:Anthranilate phosphoribosyltransferase n=1 Tax=Desulfonatronum thiosulfatophilum TaxID=617002 RepID=A0A1G6B1S8_9BACT|nr:anthranilate phosphoribosyltransferase [Desulfonatronum thiosulfatophilum]SDB14443.1 anthranilate phosphoribosyltransferase [Desulfonatronum thiosulfatophilum]